MYGYGSSPLEILACQAMVQGLVYLDEFAYSVSWIAGTQTALLASGDKTNNIQINSDSDFVAQEYNIVSSIETATPDQPAGLPDYLITITRSGSGRNIMDQPQRTLNYCGNWLGFGSKVLQGANAPGRLPITSLYQGNSTIAVRLQNLSSTFAPARVDFNMRGFKVFYQTNSAGVTGNRQQIFHAL